MPTKLMEIMGRYRPLIEDWEGWLAALENPAPTYARLNTLKGSESEICDLMSRSGLHLVPTLVPTCYELRDCDHPGHLPMYFQGLFHSQDLTSAVPSWLLNPAAGEMVLDLCAAPGSKTSHLAQLMENQGLIVANEIQTHRLKSLVANLERLGVTNTAITRYAGQDFPLRIQFDRILVDAPCSGEGTLRARQSSRYASAPRLHERLANVQGRLLARALKLLRPGGILIYSTCTYAPEENEEVVDNFLQQGGVQIEEVSCPLPHHPGITTWNDKTYSSEVTKCLRFYPSEVNSTGFFIAQFRKTGDL